MPPRATIVEAQTITYPENGNRIAVEVFRVTPPFMDHAFMAHIYQLKEGGVHCLLPVHWPGTSHGPYDPCDLTLAVLELSPQWDNESDMWAAWGYQREATA